MTKYCSLNANLSNSQLDKLNSATKNFDTLKSATKNVKNANKNVFKNIIKYDWCCKQ